MHVAIVVLCVLCVSGADAWSFWGAPKAKPASIPVVKSEEIYREDCFGAVTRVSVDAAQQAVTIRVVSRGSVHTFRRSTRELSHTRALPGQGELMVTRTNTSTSLDELDPIASTGVTHVLLKRRSIVDTTPVVIRVGVLFSQEVIAEVGDWTSLEAKVLAAFAEANGIVLPQSGVTLRLEMCVNAPIYHFAETTDAYETLRSFTASRTVKEIRDGNRCDAMVLFSTLGALSNRACGLGEVMGTHAVVAAPCFTDNYSFLHELGHMLGACHGVPPGRWCDSGRNGFADADEEFRTVMAYSAMCRGCPRVGRFSNQNARFAWNGKGIGDRTRSNADALNANAHSLAARR